MKYYNRAFCLIITSLLLALPQLRAQTYTMAWSKISGGGGTSTNGSFSVSGTIGQHDASGAMTGGNYSLTGGFWSMFSVIQTPGSPLLTIAASGNQTILSWPPSATGWILQTNSRPGAAAWGDYAGPVINNCVTNLPKAGNLFFRLSHP
jgi:hypothetical protein